MDSSTSGAWSSARSDSSVRAPEYRRRATDALLDVDYPDPLVSERRRRMGRVGRLAPATISQVILYSLGWTIVHRLRMVSRRLRALFGGSCAVDRVSAGTDARQWRVTGRPNLRSGPADDDQAERLTRAVQVARDVIGPAALARHLSPLPDMAARCRRADPALLQARVPFRERRLHQGALRTVLVFSLTLAPPLVAQPSQTQRTAHAGFYRRFFVSARRAGTEGNRHVAAAAVMARAGEGSTGGDIHSWHTAQAQGQLPAVVRAGAVAADRRGNRSGAAALAGHAPGAAVPTDGGKQGEAPADRARRGFEHLHAGRLAAAQAELDDPGFACSEQGVALRRALAQRAIYLGEAARALTHLEQLDAAGLLRTEERAQWFALLLQQGRLDDAHRLQLRVGLETPQQQLAMAHAWADRGELTAVASYMARRRPDFTREVQERQWLYLMAYVEGVSPELLRRYPVRFAANRTVQSRLLAPVAAVAGDSRPVDTMRSRYGQARFALMLRAGRVDEAARLADAMVAAPGGDALIDAFSQDLLDAGAYAHAKALLLRAYPFVDSDRAERLMGRLAQIAEVRHAVFEASDLIVLRRPPDDRALQGCHAALLASLCAHADSRAVMASLASPVAGGSRA